MPTKEEFEAVMTLIKTCPTCGESLLAREGSSTRLCPTGYHGEFHIIWSKSARKYFITFVAKGMRR